MATQEEKIEESLREILSGSVDSSVDLASNTNFVSDLGLESIQVLEFVMEVEEHFDIAIDMESLSDVHTIGELAKVVAGLVED
ncbi:MAG: acyl carrier protein [Gammaproteobacteria bacterium]